MFKILLGGVVGFLLGSRSGRGAYDQVEAWVRQMSGRPEVQRATQRVTDAASQVVGASADQAADTLNQVTDRVQS